MATCGLKCEVYSRVVGYYRPIQDWNVGKREEYTNRRVYTKAGDERLTPEPEHVRIERERASNPLLNNEQEF